MASSNSSLGGALLVPGRGLNSCGGGVFSGEGVLSLLDLAGRFFPGVGGSLLSGLGRSSSGIGEILLLAGGLSVSNLLVLDGLSVGVPGRFRGLRRTSGLSAARAERRGTGYQGKVKGRGLLRSGNGNGT